MTATSSRGAALRFLLIAVAVMVGAHLLDGWAYRHLVVEDVYGEDWGRMLRVMGFVPLWLLAGIALVLTDWPKRVEAGARAAWARGSLLLAGAAVPGLAGEILKLLLRRERPGAHEGAYVFRSFADRPFSSSGLALPSSHTIVAFGAAFMLARLFPRAAPVWYLLAAGCGLTRVFARAHFTSDVALAALAAWLVVAWLWKRWGGAARTADPQARPIP
jgi:membrane-associated phospholipid phosphatase